jgi:epoxyqueuosine reductase
MKSSASTSSKRDSEEAPKASRVAHQVKARARDIGFDLVGITTAQPPQHSQYLERWLAKGFHGEMGYLARNADKRSNPSKILADVQSIVVVGLNYYTGDHDRTGRVARYAWGTRDYHEVISGKLEQLSRVIVEIGGPGTRCLGYVDTGPILERDLAQRAGIGFIGKHANVISRQLGNWLFLGEILTNLELSPDPPEREYCGTCQRCMDVCPTRAIVGPYQLDARLCISYLTIELKGSIPVELRPLVGDHVFGCDDCLEVCPWNRFARQSPTQEFQQREMPSLTEFLSWDEPKFREFFRGTPILRIKRRGFLRNVCVVLGNTGDETALAALTRALNDDESLVREHAAWAVEQIQHRSRKTGLPHADQLPIDFDTAGSSG